MITEMQKKHLTDKKRKKHLTKSNIIQNKIFQKTKKRGELHQLRHLQNPTAHNILMVRNEKLSQ